MTQSINEEEKNTIRDYNYYYIILFLLVLENMFILVSSLKKK